MSFFIQIGDKKTEYFSLKEVGEALNCPKSMVERNLCYIKKIIGEENFHQLTYQGRDPKIRPKKRTLYISKKLKDYVERYVQAEQAKKAYYDSLTNNRKELKEALTRLQFMHENEKLHIDMACEDCSLEENIFHLSSKDNVQTKQLSDDTLSLYLD